MVELFDLRVNLGDDLYAFVNEDKSVILSSGSGETALEAHANYKEIAHISPAGAMELYRYLNQHVWADRDKTKE